jgi:hypothetical protein
VSDEEPQGKPLPLGCQVAIILWFALVVGFGAFGFTVVAICLLCSPFALLALFVLIASIPSIARAIELAWIRHGPDEWGRFVLIAAGLSWIWYIPLTFIGIRIPPGEALSSDLSVLECLGAAAWQSFLRHALPTLPLSFIALVIIRKWYRSHLYTERNDSLVFSGCLALFVWSNPFVYSHYYVLRIWTSCPIIWLVVIQLSLACACGFAIGYLPVYLRYRDNKRRERS